MIKSILRQVTWIAIIGILAVSILPNTFSNYWLIDIFSNFKLQYLFLSFLVLIAAFFLPKKRPLALILIFVSILWNGYYIAPYYLASNDLKPTRNGSFKISSINLLSNNSTTDLVTNYIEKENPDILILMELTPEWEKQLSPLLENYKYKQLVPRRDNFGIAVLSKFEMNSTIDYFDLNDKPSIVGDIIVKNEKLTVLAMHPVPPINQQFFERRNKQLSNFVKNRSRFSENLIVIGDFNTSSFSNHFDKLIQGDLKDSRIGFGLLPSWPADFKIFQTTLDHCLVSSNLIVLERSNGKNIGSDHLPINIVIGVD